MQYNMAGLIRLSMPKEGDINIGLLFDKGAYLFYSICRLNV